MLFQQLRVIFHCIYCWVVDLHYHQCCWIRPYTPWKKCTTSFNLFTNKQLAQIDCCIIVNCWVVDLHYHQCFWIRTRLAFERSVQLLLTFTNNCCIRFIVNGWVFVDLHYHQCCWIRPGLPFERTAQLLLTFNNMQLAQVDCCIIVNCWIVDLHCHQCFWIRPCLRSLHKLIVV